MIRAAAPIVIGWLLLVAWIGEALVGHAAPELFISGVALMAFGVAHFVLRIWCEDRAHARLIVEARAAYARQDTYRGDCIYEPLYVIGETEPFAQFPRPRDEVVDWERWEGP